MASRSRECVKVKFHKAVLEELRIRRLSHPLGRPIDTDDVLYQEPLKSQSDGKNKIEGHNGII